MQGFLPPAQCATTGGNHSGGTDSRSPSAASPEKDKLQRLMVSVEKGREQCRNISCPTLSNASNVKKVLKMSAYSCSKVDTIDCLRLRVETDQGRLWGWYECNDLGPDIPGFEDAEKKFFAKLRGAVPHEASTAAAQPVEDDGHDSPQPLHGVAATAERLAGDEGDGSPLLSHDASDTAEWPPDDEGNDASLPLHEASATADRPAEDDGDGSPLLFHEASAAAERPADHDGSPLLIIEASVAAERPSDEGDNSPLPPNSSGGEHSVLPCESDSHESQNGNSCVSTMHVDEARFRQGCRRKRRRASGDTPRVHARCTTPCMAGGPDHDRHSRNDAGVANRANYDSHTRNDGDVDDKVDRSSPPVTYGPHGPNAFGVHSDTGNENLTLADQDDVSAALNKSHSSERQESAGPSNDGGETSASTVSLDAATQNNAGSGASRPLVHESIPALDSTTTEYLLELKIPENVSQLIAPYALAIEKLEATSAMQEDRIMKQNEELAAYEQRTMKLKNYLAAALDIEDEPGIPEAIRAARERLAIPFEKSRTLKMLQEKEILAKRALLQALKQVEDAVGFFLPPNSMARNIARGT